MPLQQDRMPRRVRPLAALPVFFGLSGRKVLVAGGSDAAAWKAELLAATGAEVHVFAEELDPILEDLIVKGSEAGCLVHHARRWTDRDFAGAAVAVCDAETEAEAEAFFLTARAEGVPANVIDKPAYCDFHFGCIVNRSPAIVAISTDGAAPILAQAIRRRIETLLPPAIADWTALAAKLREVVAERLAPGAQRRTFWERFVDRAFGAPPEPAAAEQLIQEATEIGGGSDVPRGRVTLVGAGPGDPELLTLKAVRALQAADVILFDDLVTDEVLELARREARRMLVGKRGGRESCRQHDINDMMISLAKAGRHVVRLKGGDPMIFGRAGEEIEILRKEGIPVEVVPGITSALAMASALGVSLTHREHAHSVRLVTGHGHRGGLPPDLDWPSIADPQTTTIFYMGGRTAAAIAEALAAAGAPHNTPVVIAKAVSRPGQSVWAGQLGQLGEAMGEILYDEPVLIGIGRAFRNAVREAGRSDLAAAWHHRSIA